MTSARAKLNDATPHNRVKAFRAGRFWAYSPTYAGVMIRIRRSRHVRGRGRGRGRGRAYSPTYAGAQAVLGLAGDGIPHQGMQVIMRSPVCKRGSGL